MKNANLKPLQPNPFGTNRWNFSGKPLPPEELNTLYSRGVTDADWMPDGRLKLPKHRTKWRKTTIKQASMTREEFNEKYEEWLKEYSAEAEPRPNFFQWFAKKHPEVLAKELLWAVFDEGRKSAASKSIQTWLEHGLEKPKTQLEVSSKDEQIPEFTPEDILKMALSEFGITYEEFKERFGDLEPKKAN